MEGKEENLTRKEVSAWFAYLLGYKYQEFWQDSLCDLAFVRNSAELGAVWARHSLTE